MTPGTARRAVLRGSLLSGAVLVASACSAGAEEPEETPTPTGTPSTPERVDGAPTLPSGLQESQRTAYRYGEHPRQVSDLWLPEGERRDGLVALVHGGAWQVGTDRSNVDNIVADLVGRGFPVLNLDYRGVDDGGGWTGTFTDVATALDQAAEAADAQGVNAGRTLLLGHSAGGHLAMWAAARRRLPSGAPGADPRVVPVFAGSMSGVLRPTTLAAQDPNVVNVFGGTPEEVDDRYAVGDPSRLVPLGMPVFVLHGTADETVPYSQAQEFTDLAVAAGDQVDLQLMEGASHEDPLFPGERVWGRALDWIEASLG
ncbi:alpha/beta hydrolase family protein [Kineococcus rubinsiae]|uniref:alpha/beta hydrolase family protein n=1 Tax=Kineococcus rubinsiae TaxID=2609562 RepID=UPI001431A927|nr:alpha/beta hydrolase [Kineococcus rubinsiae]NIZ93447.1 alpha/beta hydrolase [Kineococcus rubinsiae]